MAQEENPKKILEIVEKLEFLLPAIDKEGYDTVAKFLKAARQLLAEKPPNIAAAKIAIWTVINNSKNFLPIQIKSLQEKAKTTFIIPDDPKLDELLGGLKLIQERYISDLNLHIKQIEQCLEQLKVLSAELEAIN